MATPPMNGIVSALRFLFTSTLDRPDPARLLAATTDVTSYQRQIRIRPNCKVPLRDARFQSRAGFHALQRT